MKRGRKKKTLYKKARASKTFMTFFYCFLGVLLFSGIAYATTTITENNVDSPTGTYTNLTADLITINDTVINSTGISTTNLTVTENITISQDKRICFDGATCNVYQYYNGTALITKVN